MHGIRIRDLKEGVLAFDLVDLLEVLGLSVRSSTWKCNVEWCISVEDARPNLEAAYNASKRLTGTQLLTLAAETRQIIDGSFEAFRPGEDGPWIALEAIDSTYWEVRSSDERELTAFKARFEKVQP